VIFAFTLVEKAFYSIVMLCRVLDVSRSGFHAWAKRPTAPRARSDAQLAVQVAAVHIRREALSRRRSRMDRARQSTTSRRIKDATVATRASLHNVLCDPERGIDKATMRGLSSWAIRLSRTASATGSSTTPTSSNSAGPPSKKRKY
jgi:hypothetical protein